MPVPSSRWTPARRWATDGRRPAARPVRTLIVLASAAVLLAACGGEEKAAAPEIRPVRTVTVVSRAAGDTVTLTGQVEAQNEASYGFRIGGRIIERRVNVGDRITAGQVLARLDPQNEQNAVRQAEAALSAANAQLSQTRNAYDRQRQLLARGFTPRAQYEAAEKAFLTSRSQVENAEAQLKIANDRLGYTELRADAPGTVTARRAEPGEVVQPGQTVVEVARQDGRDAVFEVPAQVLNSLPENAPVTVSLVDNAAVTASARVREIAPQADPVTRTFRVRMGLTNPPEAMRLGTTVSGRISTGEGSAIEVPASALTRLDGKPAVWVVDPSEHTVALRTVEVLRFSPATAAIASGLSPGEVVVTAGVQALHPGQKVRLLEGGA